LNIVFRCHTLSAKAIIVFFQMFFVFRFNTQELFNKEFTLFLSIIELESIKRDGVTYDDLAIKHSLSRRVINFHIKNMLLKGIPVNIVGRPNEKTLIFIKKEFKELNINQDLIKLRYYIASKGLKADHLDEFYRPYINVTFEGGDCNTDADTDCDGCVSLIEIVNLMLRYKNGETSLSLLEMVNLMLRYKGGEISC